ncbi:MAG: RagB/SusD family nutrient uptake outer membrane protein [Chitinophaga sp.]|uniref:RagB/SusD family nutrient uptake outer membrane protein n=1 Tax=Chitinophaga sp. TaxID=1869181 RepID=UPI0025C58076|nr:RagB/SusD family nutrient uptake outer membrane protein [Chitinophaga sp.]MBV8255603.1 RagB/SusD family nutrient uptake outer membrane protein [Chitinophaga sp.]
MKKISVYTLLLAMGISAGCQKSLLNPLPASDMPDYIVFDNADRIASQLNGMYTVMKNGKFLGGKFQIANEVRGEDYNNELSNNVTLQATWKRIVGNEVQEVKEIWSQAYFTINNANLFMDGMKAKGTKVVGDSLSKIYIGEAKFVRALSYFCLQQLYARPYWDGNGAKPGMILYTQGHTERGNYNKARNTTAEVYAQILQDLNDAEAALPKTAPGTAAGTTHANWYSVIALKTRVYLYMGQYANVLTEAAKIVSATAPFVSPGGHALVADINKVYSAPYTSVESMFSLPFTGTSGDYPGTQTQLGYYFTPKSLPLQGNGEYSLLSTGIISDSSWKSTTDARRKLLTKVGSKYYMTKFAGPPPFTDWAPIIRYAEVLLNYAEAKVRVSNSVDAGAIALLNAVRQRSDATVTFAVTDFASPQALIDQILKEKHIELLGEGFRSMEVTRTGATFAARATYVAVPPTASNYIWPISSDELVYNKLCVDNQ